MNTDQKPAEWPERRAWQDAARARGEPIVCGLSACSNRFRRGYTNKNTPLLYCPTCARSINESSRSAGLGDLCTREPEAPSPQEALHRGVNAAATHAIDRLTDREREVLRERFPDDPRLQAPKGTP